MVTLLTAILILGIFDLFLTLLAHALGLLDERNPVARSAWSWGRIVDHFQDLPNPCGVCVAPIGTCDRFREGRRGWLNHNELPVSAKLQDRRGPLWRATTYRRRCYSCQSRRRSGDLTKPFSTS